jgi:hypothetical protein
MDTKLARGLMRDGFSHQTLKLSLPGTFGAALSAFQTILHL